MDITLGVSLARGHGKLMPPRPVGRRDSPIRSVEHLTWPRKALRVLIPTHFLVSLLANDATVWRAATHDVSLKQPLFPELGPGRGLTNVA
jgi:hypothetical protein